MKTIDDYTYKYLQAWKNDNPSSRKKVRMSNIILVEPIHLQGEQEAATLEYARRLAGNEDMDKAENCKRRLVQEYKLIYRSIGRGKYALITGLSSYLALKQLKTWMVRGWIVPEATGRDSWINKLRQTYEITVDINIDDLSCKDVRISQKILNEKAGYLFANKKFDEDILVVPDKDGRLTVVQGAVNVNMAKFLNIKSIPVTILRNGSEHQEIPGFMRTKEKA